MAVNLCSRDLLLAALSFALLNVPSLTQVDHGIDFEDVSARLDSAFVRDALGPGFHRLGRLDADGGVFTDVTAAG